MPSPTDLAAPIQTKLQLGDFARRFAPDATPCGPLFSCHSASVPVPPEDLPDFADEPVAALPHRVLDRVGPVVLLLVPYLERPAAAGKSAPRKKRTAAPMSPAGEGDALVAFAPPAPANALTAAHIPPPAPGEPHILVFAVKDVDSSDYHFNFFHSIARLLYRSQPDSVLAGYRALLREELKNRAHGEVDDASWKAKIELLKKETGVRGESKLFLEYAEESFIDTCTLYLHGICCDIDVEPGPRQIASRYLRKRLQFLQAEYPQPEGYAVFPEELKS